MCAGGRLLFGAALFANQRFVDVRDDTTAGDRRLDQTVQFFVSADGKLQVTGSDTLHLQILGGVAGQLEHLQVGRNDKIPRLI